MADPAKTTWPELLSKTYDEAKTVIANDNPDLEVSKVLPGQPMTRDLRPDRVRIMVDSNDIVIQVPNVG